MSRNSRHKLEQTLGLAEISLGQHYWEAHGSDVPHCYCYLSLGQEGGFGAG